ncbi:Hypothetical_protein [Hexamita inflata]|uniref:Hypothetical_protein n=1 Tax=Hexamita inflata TaxID=28002 RepID=A0AA86UWS9_9EUKA|nr:Hypothetical protein HINF_LOCUS55442 [Hexamita inflata]
MSCFPFKLYLRRTWSRYSLPTPGSLYHWTGYWKTMRWYSSRTFYSASTSIFVLEIVRTVTLSSLEISSMISLFRTDLFGFYFRYYYYIKQNKLSILSFTNLSSILN